MSVLYCNNRSSCTLIAIVSSIILGVITAFLRITAVITVTPVFLWVLLSIAVAYLLGLLIAFVLAQRERHLANQCQCTLLSVLLISIIGVVLLSIVLLAIEFAATSIIGAILTGLLLLFFFQLIETTACFILCLNRCNE